MKVSKKVRKKVRKLKWKIYWKKLEKKRIREKELEEKRKRYVKGEIDKLLEEPKKEKFKNKFEGDFYAVIGDTVKDLGIFNIGEKDALRLSEEEKKEKNKFSNILIALWAYGLNGRKNYLLNERLKELDEIFKEKIYLGYNLVKEEIFSKILEVVDKGFFIKLRNLSLLAETLYMMESDSIRNYIENLATLEGWTENNKKTEQFKLAFEKAKENLKEISNKPQIKDFVIKKNESFESQLTVKISEVLNFLKRDKEKFIQTIKVLPMVNENFTELFDTIRSFRDYKPLFAQDTLNTSKKIETTLKSINSEKQNEKKEDEWTIEKQQKTAIIRESGSSKCLREGIYMRNFLEEVTAEDVKKLIEGLPRLRSSRWLNKSEKLLKALKPFHDKIIDLEKIDQILKSCRKKAKSDKRLKRK